MDLPVLPWTHEQVVESYKERRLRVRYEEARQSLLADGLCGPKDAQVAAFVKAEKLANYKVHKPRIIMGRTPRYNLELAAYLKPLEHALYPAFRGWGRMFLTRTRLIGKGLNGEERASLLRRKLYANPGTVCFEVDCKSFESHVSVEQLIAEHETYTTLCRDPRLRELLSWQREFSGGFRSGVRFRAKGCRASGDFNTGLGNTLIMCCLVLASAKRIGSRFDFLADGDNAVIFVPCDSLHLWLRELSQCFLSMGHEAEIGEVQSEIEGVVFGQSKPICIGGRWTMIRDPLKVMSHAFAGHQHYAELRGAPKILRAVALCEAYLNRGVPVLQDFAQAMLKWTRNYGLPKDPGFDNLEYQRVWPIVRARGAVEAVTIDSVARVLFEKSWGVTIEDQLRLEVGFKVPGLPHTWEGVPIDRTFAGALDPWDLPLGQVEADWIARWSIR
uniref:RNA-directed RNA polymerase n=1 Tax=Riboviria sp. TaxID=2585031 RepID=A0A514D8K3_9VIRU|nr:MAG: RNA-dependent RNA polymerase [Riboviria sp.]